MKNTGERSRRGFSKALYSKLKTSVLAAVFTSYRDREKKSIYDSGFGRRVLSPALKAVSSKISSCVTSEFLKKAAAFLLSLKLRVYGTFLVSFGIYTAIFYLANNFILSDDRKVSDILVGAVVALAALPILFSDETLSSALTSSRLGAQIMRVTGIRREKIQTERVRGKSNHGFLAGIAAGVISYFISPLAVIFVLLSLAALWLISASPEFGAILLLFSIPFLNLSNLTALLAATLISFALKVVRGKRYVTFETLDAAVLGIFLVLIFASIGTHSGESSSISLRMALYITVYFLAANLMRSKGWLDRASSSLVAGVAAASGVVTAVSVAGIFFTGAGAGFAGVLGRSLLTGRLTGADPAAFNMLIASAFPIALSHFIHSPEGVGRRSSAVALLLMIYPLVEHRSLFAIISIAAASMLLLMIYSGKFIYLPISLAVVGVASSLLFPNFWGSVSRVFGTGFDSFTNLRSSAWHSATDILSRSFIAGIGFGKGAIHTASAAPGKLPADHVYNTYLQFWIESGILGFVLLIVFVWLIVTAFFKTADTIDLARHSSVLKGDAPTGRRKSGDALSFAQEFALSRRLAVAGPFCSTVCLLIYAMGDHIWEDPAVFLVFWAVAGLASAGVRGVREEINDHEASSADGRDIASAECDLPTV